MSHNLTVIRNVHGKALIFEEMTPLMDLEIVTNLEKHYADYLNQIAKRARYQAFFEFYCTLHRAKKKGEDFPPNQEIPIF